MANNRQTGESARGKKRVGGKVDADYRDFGEC
jgi:hypothetical protein